MLSTAPHPTSPNSNSSVFGLIAIAICIVSLFSIRLFLSMISIGIVIFAIIGLVRDSSKIWSVAALIWVAFLFYSEMDRSAADSKFYKVRYEVECSNCTVKYTNDTGGDVSLEDVGRMSKEISVKGDQSIDLFAHNDYRTEGSITVNIYVNDQLLKTETSSGKGASASVYCFPKESDGY